MTPTITAFTAELLRLPLDRPVGGSGVAQIDVLAVDLTDIDGATGTGFSYCLSGGAGVVLAGARDLLDTRVQGQAAHTPEALWRHMAASLNRIGRGAHNLAMAAIDVAAWDLHARRLDLPLGIAMGGTARDLPVYGSADHRPNHSPEETRDLALAQVAQGFSGVKPRLSGDGTDGARLSTLRAALPDRVRLMADVNEKCDPATALHLAAACADAGCLWLEEPMPAGNTPAFARLAAASPVAIAAGEHLQGMSEVMPYLTSGALHVLQPDLAMMGGLTPCLMAARAAESFGLPVAPHFLPSLFIHLAAAQPNVTWLEDFPLLEPLFDITARTENGAMALPILPGHGMAWAEGARKRYRLDG
ncbi:MAG: mandelate racemase/muconate lactonizing enzyme family protein [Alphaproteobacteria bacterium]